MTSFVPAVVAMHKRMAEERGRKFRLRRPTKFLLPLGTERRYALDLRKIVDEVAGQLEETLIPQLGFISRASQLRDDLHTDIEDISAIINGITGPIQARLDNTILRNAQSLVEGYFNETSRHGRTQLLKQIKSVLQVDAFPQEQQLESMRKAFVQENMLLATDLGSKTISDVNSTVLREVQAGTRPKDIATKIRERFDISKRRANLIARDQTNKLNSTLTRMRQKSLGIEQYIWRTSRDERVRPSHLALEGTVHSWDDPPAIGHPGQPINCRCTAEPVIEGVPPPPEDRAQVIREVEQKREKLQRREREKRERKQQRKRAATGRKVTGQPFKRSNSPARPSDPEQAKVFDAVDQWVHGSRSRGAIVMKQAAKDELGLQGVAFTRRKYNIKPDEVLEGRRTVRRMYEQTQAQLERDGVESVKLYRGVKENYTTPGALESWTTDVETAKKFAGKNGSVIVEDIPRSRILNGVTLDHWHNGRFGNQAEWIVTQ